MAQASPPEARMSLATASSGSRERATRTTRQPARASERESAAPRPRLAPVTRAVRCNGCKEGAFAIMETSAVAISVASAWHSVGRLANLLTEGQSPDTLARMAEAELSRRIAQNLK